MFTREDSSQNSLGVLLSQIALKMKQKCLDKSNETFSGSGGREEDMGEVRLTGDEIRETGVLAGEKAREKREM